jgi:ABC-type spermidine/putrescine transport system permease subunit II
MNKKIIILPILLSLIIPNFALACEKSFQEAILTILLLTGPFILFTIFLIIVIIKSIRQKKIYRGRLNIILIILFVVTFCVITKSVHDSREVYKQKQEFINECKKNCIASKNEPNSWNFDCNLCESGWSSLGCD